MERLGAFCVVIDRVNGACYGICIADWAIVGIPMKGFLRLHFATMITEKNSENEDAKPSVMKSIRSR